MRWTTALEQTFETDEGTQVKFCLLIYFASFPKSCQANFALDMFQLSAQVMQSSNVLHFGNSMRMFLMSFIHTC